MKKCIPIVAFVTAAFLTTGPNAAEEHAPGHARRERQFTLEYRVRLSDLPNGHHKLHIWVPVPQNTWFQNVWDLEVQSNLPYQILSEPEYGNRMLHANLEGELPEEIEIVVRFEARRKALSAWAGDELASSKPEELRRFLQPDSLVPISGKIAEEAHSVVGNERDPVKRARLLYDHLVETMLYDKSGQGWGRGDALYACDVRRGNCTDFHSLFIGMARALGIPARFVIGFPLPDDKTEGEIAGYHCWAEFHVNGKGWIPVDASEAHKHPDKRNFFFGGLDENRIAFTLGRDIQLVPKVTARRLNYFIYPYVLLDNQDYSQVETKVLFRDIAAPTVR